MYIGSIDPTGITKKTNLLPRVVIKKNIYIYIYIPRSIDPLTPLKLYFF
jgi:hypothetical protein